MAKPLSLLFLDWRTWRGARDGFQTRPYNYQQ
jgi:hypothetical protein